MVEDSVTQAGGSPCPFSDAVLFGLSALLVYGFRLLARRARSGGGRDASARHRLRDGLPCF